MTLDLPESLVGVRVLHLACGAGEKSLDLARQGAVVIGVDPSRSDILAARQRATDSGIAARFVISELAELRHMLPEPESFGIVVASAAVADTFADLIAWFLEPDGRLVVAN